MWEATGEKPIILQIRIQNGDESVMVTLKNMQLDWNLQRTRKRGRPKQTWDRTVLEKEGKCGKIWSEVKCWRNSQMEILHKCPRFLME
jgi:hypothetical protein